ncbi:MAG: ATP-binding cassette domain-containing protein [Rickettsiales bacterium]|jgi:cell division transport system ATP-binding protein|nr:ATP-binding cassette domain-containing protein [Rickettsiales bacterium]
METQNLISFMDVGTRYEAGPEILSNVSFNINSGQFFFLTGKSGAGKTTLLRLIYHLHKKTRGQIKLFGKNTANLTPDELIVLRRKMSIIFQDYSLISHLSVFDNVALPLRVRGISEADVIPTVMKTLQWVGLEKYARARPLSLSGGQQQKVAVARAVITRPKILLADEPTANLDDDSATKLMDLFVRMKKDYGCSIIIATHGTALMNAYDFHRIRVENGTVRFANGAARSAEEENYFPDLSRRFADIIQGV